jgi:hypothetical protein
MGGSRPLKFSTGPRSSALLMSTWVVVHDQLANHALQTDDHPSSLRSGGCSPLNARSLGS